MNDDYFLLGFRASNMTVAVVCDPLSRIRCLFDANDASLVTDSNAGANGCFKVFCVSTFS